jgi:multiple antibiotic resistance protein
MISNLLNTVLVTTIALLPITNPVSTAALFLSITGTYSDEYRKKQALKGTIYTFSILVVFLVAGTLIMQFFGISIPGLRIAGGVMVIKVATSMLKAKEEVEAESKEEAKMKEDISFSPLAMPSLSGPGAIAVTIGLSAGTDHWAEYIAIIVGIIIVVGIAYITLLGSDKIIKFLGKTGMNALSKIMGFLLLCVGIQFLIDAFMSILADPEFIQDIIKAVNSIT